MSDTPPRRHPGGRPPLAPNAPSKTLSMRMTAPHYDRLSAIARARGQSMGAVVRTLIMYSLRTTSS